MFYRILIFICFQGLLASCVDSLRTNLFNVFEESEWEMLRPLDYREIQVSQFPDHQLVVVNEYFHFHRIANSVIAYGNEKGFITLPVWQTSEKPDPRNVRIMENVLPMTFFYCQKTPWNAYFQDLGLKLKVTAGLEYWTRLQGKNGFFKDYKTDQDDLSLTALQAKLLAQSFANIESCEGVEFHTVRTVKEALFRSFKALENHRTDLKYRDLWNFRQAMLLYFQVTGEDKVREILMSLTSDLQAMFAFLKLDSSQVTESDQQKLREDLMELLQQEHFPELRVDQQLVSMLEPQNGQQKSVMSLRTKLEAQVVDDAFPELAVGNPEAYKPNKFLFIDEERPRMQDTAKKDVIEEK